MNRRQAGILGGIAATPLNIQKKEVRIIEYNKNPKQCITCNSVISYDKRRTKFCSHRCAAIYNNKKFPKRSRPLQFCLNCNAKLNHVGKYCSSNCMQEYRYQTITAPKIKAGHGGRGDRRFLIELHGELCSECGQKPEWNGKKLQLHLDHIDGHRTNNKIENLRLVCPNCHSQTETYAGRNNGNFIGMKVADKKLLTALSTNKSICSALVNVGMAISGPNYKRCYRLLAEEKFSMRV